MSDHPRIRSLALARSTSDFHSKTASLQGRVAYLLLDGHSVEAYEMDSVTEHRAIVDTHRHPIGPKLAAKMAEAGLYDPKKNSRKPILRT